MARSADSSSGAGARALARRPSNRRQNRSFFFGPTLGTLSSQGKGLTMSITSVSIPVPLQYYDILSVGHEGPTGMYLLRTISALHFPAPWTADIRDWGELIRLGALNADVYREHPAVWAPASVFQSEFSLSNNCDVWRNRLR